MAELQCQGFPNRVLKDVVASVQAHRVMKLRNVAQKYVTMAKKAWGTEAVDPETVRDYMFELHRPAEVR